MRNKYNISLVKVTLSDIEKSKVIFKANELIHCTDDNTYRWGNGKDLMKNLPIWSTSDSGQTILKFSYIQTKDDQMKVTLKTGIVGLDNPFFSVLPANARAYDVQYYDKPSYDKETGNITFEVNKRVESDPELRYIVIM